MAYTNTACCGIDFEKSALDTWYSSNTSCPLNRCSQITSINDCNPSTATRGKIISLKEDILVLLRKNNINFIDIDKVFRDSSKNIESYFPLNFYGHYSKKGYSIVAESIANYIKK